MKTQLKQLLFLNSFFVFAFNMFIPLYALYVQKIEPAIYHIGGIWSFYILSFGVLVLIISRFENKKKKAIYFIIAGFLIRALGWLAYIFASSLLHIYLIQLILALGESLGTPSYNLIYSNYLSRGHFASDWGVDKALSAFVIAAASFTGGLIVYYFNFNVLFIIMIGLSIFSSLLAFKYRKSFSGLF